MIQPEEGGIYVLKARNLICGIYHNMKFYGFRTKFGDTYIDSEWVITDNKESSGTASALKKIGCIALTETDFEDTTTTGMLWNVLSAVDTIAEELWSAWYKEYVANFNYDIKHVSPANIKEANDIIEHSKAILRSCDNQEAEQFIAYIAARMREIVAQTYTP